MATHSTPDGVVTHGVRAESPELLYLGDNAAFGFGLARLYEVTHERAYIEAAARIARFLLNDLLDPERGGFFGSTPDPNAVGVFSARQKPFEENVAAVRFFS